MPARLLTLLCFVMGLQACGTTGTGIAPGLALSEQPLPGKFVWHDLVTDDLATARR